MAPPVTSFFQIILNSTFQEKKLKFPNKFVHEHGNKLYDTVRLSVPTGCCWDVKIKREYDGTVWLHDGFHEFMEANSIGIEYFLVFKYEGNSKFTVHIYSSTATEILYSCRSDSERRDVHDLQMDETREVSDDDIDDSPRYESGDEDADDDRGKASDDHADDSLNSADKDSDDDIFESSDEDADDDGDDSYIYEGRHKDFNNGGVGSPKYENDGMKSTMYKDTTRNDGTNASPSDSRKKRIIEPEDKSSQNFFNVTVTHYYTKIHLMKVPVDFARLHMPHSTMLIKLVDCENREWTVRYIHQGRNRALSSGWRRFLQDKKLIVGDVCMFERVLDDEEVKLRVTISRSDLKKSTMYRYETRNGGTNASPRGMGKERITDPENKSLPNFFKVTLTPHYLKRNQLTVPSVFARLHIHHSTRLIKLVDTENNEWAVHYIHQDRQKMLGSGWGHFVQDKELMAGDVCIFERVSGDDEVKLRVTISRSDGKKSTMYKETTRNDGDDASPSDFAKERIIEPEPENNSLPNFCKVTLTPAYIAKRLLRVPVDFARLNMPYSTRLIKLVDGENSEWPVRYIHQGYNNVLSSGWLEFVQDKKLMVGDVCMFERVWGGNEVKLRVTISRYGSKQH